jgi:amino acid adenylation domain-containing protein
MTSMPKPRPNNRFVEFRVEDTRQTIAERFEQQVLHYPERLAVKCDRRTLTYAELNRAANRLAHAILSRAGAEAAPLALYCSAGLPTTIACLGALKAGKAFAPLDGRLPLARIRQILATLETAIVVTDNKYSKAARQLAGPAGKTINIDRLTRSWSPDNPGLTVSPDSTAYISFTSGSTGAPKGVVWNHRSELFGLRTKTNALGISARDRISLLRANNVGAMRDMFLALLNGAGLIVLDLDENGLASLGRWLRDEEITVLSCVATLFRHAVSGTDSGDCFPRIRLIHIGGEPVFKSDVELFKRHFRGDCLFASRYSISETQAISYFFIDKQTEISAERVPVGYPVEGNEIVVLDDGGKPVGPGQIGEIAIRSPYLASGYWRNPELTRAKFLADPMGGENRMYLTGDLGYLLADSCLVHVGRKDFQVKIRGHRVEVTAVETALHEIPSVRQAAVITQSDSTNGDRLIAYVVPRHPAVADSAEWRKYLKTRLPDYMVPFSFVVLDRLPVNAGGKVDRRRLPEPPRHRRALAAPMVSPQNAVEKVVVAFWRDALGIPTPGVEDDFTELGGNSLQAARIVARVQELFPLDEPLATLAQAPTIEALARFIIIHERVPGQSEKIAAVFLRLESLPAADVVKALQQYKDSASDG